MTKKEHIQKHKKLHIALDELVADMIGQTECSLQVMSVMDLMKWSHTQTLKPTERK